MIYYDLRVEKQKIFGADKFAIAANANETVSLRFRFDASWRVFDDKAAIFKTAENKFYIIEIKSSAVTVPWEVLCVDNDFELSVIGYDGEMVLTAGKVTVSVASSLMPEDCKTFSPTETLFDRFKQESLDEAYKKYKSEIESLKRSYETQIIELGTKINKANQNTENMEKTKNEEIAELNQKHSAEVHSLNEEIADINEELAKTKIKADKWDLVDAAMADKTQANYAPWCGGTQTYKLPFFNTKKIKTISSGNIDNYVSELGLDMSSVTSLDSIFKEKSELRYLELRNTDNVTTLLRAFEASVSLREVILGNITSCITIRYAFEGNTSLEKVTIGKNGRIQDFAYSFCGCISLKEIIGELDFTVATIAGYMFDKCSSLETVSFTEETIRLNIDMGACKSLSKESMLSLFNGLAVKDSMNVTVSRYAFENNFKTAAEQVEAKKIVTDKGWTLMFN